MTMTDDARRVTVTFSGPTYHTLDELATDKGKSKADVLREAIALEKWFTEATREGRVLVERDGKTREVIPR